MEEIIETTVVPEVKEELTLEQRLALATDKKPEPEIKKVDTSFFGSDDDINETDSAENKEFKATAEIKPDAPKAPITEKAKRGSASVAVGMLDMTLQTLLTPIHGWKFKRKFKAEDVKKIEEYIDDSNIDALEDEKDKQLKRKWDKLFKKYEKNKEAIPLDTKEKNDLEEAFYTYFNYKETTLPPEWFIGMAIINTIGKRAIDLID